MKFMKFLIALLATSVSLSAAIPTTTAFATNNFRWTGTKMELQAEQSLGYLNITNRGLVVSKQPGATGYVAAAQMTIDGIIVDPRNFGVPCDNLTDATAAFQNMLNILGENTRIMLPFNTPILITDTLTISGDRVHVIGGGSWTSTIRFEPTADNKPLFRVERTGQQVFQGSFEGFRVISSSTRPKTAFRLVDTSMYNMYDVVVYDFYGGNASVAVETQGRELLLVDKNCRWTADIPLYINKRPGASPAGYLSADHFRFNDLYLSSTNRTTPLIKIEDGVHLSSTIFKDNSWNGGAYGIYWNDTSSLATSEGLTIINCRKEQNFDTNGYALYLNMKGTSAGGGNLQGLNLMEFTMDGACNGIYARNITTITMLGCTYPGVHKFIDIIGKPSSTTMSWKNMTFLNGLVDGAYRPLFSIVGMRPKFVPGKMGSNDPLPPSMDFDSMSTTNLVLMSAQNWGGTVSAPAILNGTDIDQGVLTALAIGALSSTNPVSGFGAAMDIMAHNNTNGPVVLGRIKGEYTSPTPGSESARIGITAMDSGTGQVDLAYFRHDGRVLLPFGWIQVDDSGTPLKIGAAGGISQPAGTVYWNLDRNQTHGGLRINIVTSNTVSHVVTSNTVVTVNGSDKNVYLGDSGNLLPSLFFWPDNSGARIRGLGQGLELDAKLGNIQFTNTSTIKFDTIGWFKGAGSPEGVVTASVGAIYSRLDGGTSTTLYVKETGTGSTGWVAK